VVKKEEGEAMKVLLGIVAVVALVALWLISVANGLVARHENMSGAWAQIETVLQRRYDLIPNLVETVKGYAAHEKGLFEDVARLRSQWAAARTTDEKVTAASQMEAGLGRLIAVAEQYPDLKASQNFRDLQFELAGTENRIAVERQRYNDAVRLYNTAVRQFPGSIVAGYKGMTTSDAYFKTTTPEAKEPVKVKF
jgi:LemA protein